MAVENPDNRDNFELEWGRVRQDIKIRFGELVNCLKTREDGLLREMDGILASYHAYRREYKVVREKKLEIEKIKMYHQSELASSRITSVHENFISQLTAELKAIEAPIEPKLVTFECDSNKMLAELNKLGKLVEKVITGIDYESKKQPLVSVCERGNGNQQLGCPCGVTVENKTGNIYIADQSNNCMKVFDSTGKYLFKFGDSEGEGKMNKPIGVAICGDMILVTQCNHCILKFQLNGKFISRIGRGGIGKLEFSLPFGLTIDEQNGDIYICDRNNNRIQIICKDFSLKSEFGSDTLQKPRDVKLSREYIYVLDSSNPCLHLFNYKYILQKSVIPRGERLDVINPFFFFTDRADNIIISDRESNSIRIFNSKFQLVHKIPVSNLPTGVTVDTQGRVIVVCQADRDCLQIF